MKLIVGLGNPGPAHQTTRHNVGFLVIDAFTTKLADFSWKSRHKGKVGRYQDCIFLKPETYMNLSGDSVSSVKAFYQLDNSDILIIYDDLNIPEGNFKLSVNKGPGGHNGIKNIIDRLGGTDFNVLRVGIGPRAKGGKDIADYVMEEMDEATMSGLRSLAPIMFKAIRDFMSGCPVAELQNRHNRYKR